MNEILNIPVQGTSADITKLALANLPAALEETGAKIIYVVHNEIILQVAEDRAGEAAQILERFMIEAGQKFLSKIPVQVEAKVCDNWGDK